MGVDAIWWSDHDFRISSYQHPDHFGFESDGEALDAGEDWQIRLRRHSGDQKTITSASAGLPEAFGFVTEPVREGQRSLLLRSEGRGPEFQNEAAIVAASRQLQRRPLAGGVRMGLSIFPERLNPDSRPYVRILLSEHAPQEGLELEQYSLRYFLTDSAPLKGWREGATFHQPIQAESGRWNDLKLELSQDVALAFPFLEARDNALYRIILGVEARNGQTSQAAFDALSFEHERRGASMYALQAEVIEAVARRYPKLQQHQGLEISYASRHLNEFSLQPELLDYDALGERVGLEGSSEFYDEAEFRRLVTSTAVEDAHRRGGLVSYNHLFGVGMENTPVGRDREEVLARMLRNDGFGVDLLEVGYRDRAGANLEDHLWVWDQMALAGLRPVGTGVSDSHGGPAERWSGRPNNFVSWIYAPSASKANLLEGLRQGRVYFGDIERFQGRLDMRSSAGWRMGQIVVSESPSIDLDLCFEGAQRGDRLRIHLFPSETLELELEAGDQSLPFRREDTSEGTKFVRLGLYGSDGQAKAFSNPLHFLRPEDVAGGAPIPSARLGLDLTGLRSRSAQGFQLNSLKRLPRGGWSLGVSLEPHVSTAELRLDLGSAAQVEFRGELTGELRRTPSELLVEFQGGSGVLEIGAP